MSAEPKLTIEVTASEASDIGFALKELSSRYAEKSIDFPGQSKDFAARSREFYELADRVYNIRSKAVIHSPPSLPLAPNERL